MSALIELDLPEDKIYALNQCILSKLDDMGELKSANPLDDLRRVCQGVVIPAAWPGCKLDLICLGLILKKLGFFIKITDIRLGDVEENQEN